MCQAEADLENHDVAGRVAVQPASAMSRRIFCATALAALATNARAAQPPSDITYSQDFDELWQTLADRYCSFGDKTTDWNQVRSRYRPRALNAASNDDMIAIVQDVLAELYDPHTHLSNPPDGSPRWPPYDLLVEPRENHARIQAVEPGSAAALAGLDIGDLITAVDGVPLRAAAQARMPTCLVRPDPAATRYAINVAVAGRRAEPRALTLIGHSDGKIRTVALPVRLWPPQPDLEFRTLEGGAGYILIRSFEKAETVAAFQHALEKLKDTPGLIIDVRDNGGGDTAVARPIMGRFINRRLPYALMRRREGAGLSLAWTEYVESTGPFTYTRPVIVLTGPWSGSMAEGFPMGMRDIGRATIVGTRMMGLGAAVFRLRLDRTGIDAQYSAEPVYDTRSRPRSQLCPDMELPAGEDALAAGERELWRQIHS